LRDHNNAGTRIFPLIHLKGTRRGGQVASSRTLEEMIGRGEAFAEITVASRLLISISGGRNGFLV
jgi:hypothetical protein